MTAYLQWRATFKSCGTCEQLARLNPAEKDCARCPVVLRLDPDVEEALELEGRLCSEFTAAIPGAFEWALRAFVPRGLEPWEEAALLELVAHAYREVRAQQRVRAEQAAAREQAAAALRAEVYGGGRQARGGR